MRDAAADSAGHRREPPAPLLPHLSVRLPHQKQGLALTLPPPHPHLRLLVVCVTPRLAQIVKKARLAKREVESAESAPKTEGQLKESAPKADGETKQSTPKTEGELFTPFA